MQVRDDADILKDIAVLQLRDKAFNELVKKYQGRLYWHIRKITVSHDDANDVMQNTFIKIWKNIDSFHGESKLYTWLYRIATNESITFLNSKKRFVHPNIDEVNNDMIARLESDSYFDGNEAQLKLQQAILRLPDKQRIVFNMRYFDEISYEDMSEILETSVGALKASFHHAVKKVEEFVKNN